MDDLCGMASHLGLEVFLDLWTQRVEVTNNNIKVPLDGELADSDMPMTKTK